MKTLGVFALSLVATAALADSKINRTLDADADGEVSISNVSGSIEVSGWSRDQVEVTGTLSDRVRELIFERDGDEVEIKVKLERNSRRNSNSHLVVKVPEGSSLRINTVNADIDIEKVKGEQHLDSVSGDITTSLLGAEIDVETVNGDVDIEGNEQDARVRLISVSGDVEVKGLSGEMTIESVNGDLIVENGSFSRVSGNTVNGDFSLDAELRRGGRMNFETVNGEVDIEFTGDVSAEFDIETFNGDIDNCFGPESVRVSKYTPGRELDFTEGSGDGRVRIKTLNGDVTLCK